MEPITQAAYRLAEAASRLRSLNPKGYQDAQINHLTNLILSCRPGSPTYSTLTEMRDALREYKAAFGEYDREKDALRPKTTLECVQEDPQWAAAEIDRLQELERQLSVPEGSDAHDGVYCQTRSSQTHVPYHRI